MSFKEWDNLIQENFEKHFYVSTIPAPGDSTLINKRGIYKDSVNSSRPWADFQLRPNFPIAMAVVSIFLKKYILLYIKMKLIDKLLKFVFNFSFQYSFVNNSKQKIRKVLSLFV